MTFPPARLAAALAVASVLAAGSFPASRAAIVQPVSDDASAPGASDYRELCGGCHGMTGSSAPAKLPQLRGRVGYFMCTRQGRDYLIRLPNVSHAALSDPQYLATLMNYVVFTLGRGSAPPGAQPYRADEVAALRLRPLDLTSLTRERGRIVSGILRQCRSAPASLRTFY